MKKILVVDDEADIRETLKMILETAGYEVMEAVNGDDCLKKQKKFKPDLILLDIMMPGTPVREVVRRIKGTKIIFCSIVRTSEAEREELFKSKCVVDFIHKPFEVKDVLKTVEKYLK